MLDEVDKRYQQRFVEQEKAILTALAANDRRLDGMNEFRDTLKDQAATFIPRSEYDARENARTDVEAAITARVSENQRILLPRSEYGPLHEALVQRVEELFDALAGYRLWQATAASKEEVSKLRDSLSNMQGRSAAYVVAVGFAFALVQIALHFIR